MLALYYAPGACSMAAHIVLEESGEKYQPQKVDLASLCSSSVAQASSRYAQAIFRPHRCRITSVLSTPQT